MDNTRTNVVEQYRDARIMQKVGFSTDAISEWLLCKYARYGYDNSHVTEAVINMALHSKHFDLLSYPGWLKRDLTLTGIRLIDEISGLSHIDMLAKILRQVGY